MGSLSLPEMPGTLGGVNESCVRRLRDRARDCLRLGRAIVSFPFLSKCGGSAGGWGAAASSTNPDRGRDADAWGRPRDSRPVAMISPSRHAPRGTLESAHGGLTEGPAACPVRLSHGKRAVILNWRPRVVKRNVALGLHFGVLAVYADSRFELPSASLAISRAMRVHTSAHGSWDILSPLSPMS